jgi:hypothetical protein
LQLAVGLAPMKRRTQYERTTVFGAYRATFWPLRLFSVERRPLLRR